MPRPSYRTCTVVSAQCPVEATTYGYFPILGVNAFFAAFFAALLILQLCIGIRTKTWTFTLALGIGTLLELLGYLGRILMHSNPWNSGAFQMQICCLILAPSFIAAAIYLTLKHLVLHFGPEYSRLKARLYPWVFVGADFGSIVLQALGGGVAAAAGISFQVATMAACGILVLDFAASMAGRKRLNGPSKIEQSGAETSQQNTKTDPKLKIFCSCVTLAYLTVMIRCIYRLPEMAGGWGNTLMRKEMEFLLLDGMMVGIAVLALSLAHPGVLFAPMRFASKSRKHSETHISQ